VSILPSGLTKPAGLGRLPLDAFLEARMSESTTVDPARPIPPADQPARLAALVAAVRRHHGDRPEVGIVLGSGLGGLAGRPRGSGGDPIRRPAGWPAATAPGHVGRLLLGRLGGRDVVMLQGRFHLYEGNAPGWSCSRSCCSTPLGARIVVLTNAAAAWTRASGPGRSWSSPTTST
jgi:hypothetical protein